MIDRNTPRVKSPVFAGLLFICFALSGCESAKTPDEVTRSFWTALIDNDLATAENYVTDASKASLAASSHDYSNITSLETGKVIIDGEIASVETILKPEDTSLSTRPFETALVIENELWRIDYRRTRQNMAGTVFDGFFKSLENLGEKFQNQFEKQLPLLEKEIESFGEKMEKQLEEFGRELEKKLPSKQPEPQPDTI
ncbi:hypothetical protein [Methylotuvimicrobium buryatense]|uniref:DUF4878 domain-containing protein n=1 Tax=Methylotuvimicrobium buryatense TaxID=95641 RepID=A0A4P9ULU1_METBY|nr:hypothetical protein [Methylotuvimicrobium buryatense]QCW82097.1 hypothetical protein EQU24_07435 [Methylotuvimicrobium buryatense]